MMDEWEYRSVQESLEEGEEEEKKDKCF